MCRMFSQTQGGNNDKSVSKDNLKRSQKRYRSLEQDTSGASPHFLMVSGSVGYS